MKKIHLICLAFVWVTILAISLFMTDLYYNMISDPQEKIKISVNIWAFVATISGAFIIFYMNKLAEFESLKQKK